MRRRQTPPRKKQLDYDEQIRPLIENPHAFRKNWPRKKARVNRGTRRSADAVIRQAVTHGDIEDLTAGKIKTLRKGREIKKSYVMTLRNSVKRKQAARAKRRDR